MSGNIMMLLKTKMADLMIRLVKSGVPPVSAGMTLGMPAKTVGLWVNCGMQFIEEAPEKPKVAAKSMTCDGLTITEGEWYKHELECARLAKEILLSEGKMVSALVKRMWKSSGKNPEMMKFLFKQYTHAHGLVESNGRTVKAEEPEGDGADAVQIVLPDNGRLLVKVDK